MNLETQQRIEEICQAFEEVFRFLDPDFPNGCCVSSCYALAGYLTMRVWSNDADHFTHVSGEFDEMPHHWMVYGDVIVDPTLGQFTGSDNALGIVRPTDTLYKDYEVEDVIWPPSEVTA